MLQLPKQNVCKVLINMQVNQSNLIRIRQSVLHTHLDTFWTHLSRIGEIFGEKKQNIHFLLNSRKIE